MDDDKPRGGKAKLIAWCIAIAAVAMVYIMISNGSSAGSSLKTSDTAATVAPDTASGSTPSITNSNTAYKDGTYSASGSYRTPQSIETIQVSITVKSNTVSDVSIEQEPQNRDAVVYQEAFREAYKPFVVGKLLNDIKLSRVSGSSLTSIGFNEAVDAIKSQASEG